MSIKINDAPIACMLGAGEFKERSAWISELNSRSLTSIRRSSLSLELTYERGARDDVKELVRREQQCCGFLSFSTREEKSHVTVVISTPERAKEAADHLFDQFIAGHESKVVSETSGEPSPRNQVVKGAAATAALGIAACAACCALPFALPAIGLASFGGATAWISGGQLWLAAAAVTLLVAAWIWVWRMSAKTARKPARATLWGLGAASVITLGAFTWPAIEALVC